MTAPTLEPVEHRVVLNIETVLRAISPASLTADFYTTVRSVHVMDKAPAAVVVDQPAIAIFHLGTERDQYCQDLDLCFSRFELWLVLNRGQNWRRDLQRFTADVRKALLLDRNRGSTNTGQPNQMANAFDTDVLEVHPGNFIDGHNVAMAQMNVTVTYRESIFDPTQSG